MPTRVDRITELVPGLPLDEALQVFEQSCNHPGRLWITESWFAPRSSALRACLTDPITSFEADLLRQVLLKEFGLNRAIQFLRWRGGRDDAILEEFERAEAEAERAEVVELGEEGFFPWPDVDACRNRRIPRPILATLRSSSVQCPGCRRAASELTWFEFDSPPWTWQSLCGRRGWMAVCDSCRLQVWFEATMIN